MSGHVVPERHGHAVAVLDMGEVLGIEGDLRAPFPGVLEQDRFHQRLRNVEHRARAGLQIIPVPLVPRAPGAQPGDFLARQTGGEQGIAHVTPGNGVLGGFFFHTQVPQYLHGPLVRDVCAGSIGEPVPPRKHVDAHALGGQCQSRRGSGRAGADNEHIRVEFQLSFHHTF